MTSRQRWTLVATIIGSGAVFLDGTIVNVALKQIGQDLPASILGVLEGQTYVVSGYLATLAALLILAGALADHYGRRRVYSIGLVGFAATSALCGLAPSLEWLVVFRLAQGAAGALLVPGSLALITHAFDDVSRGRAFGIWAASTAGLTVIAPALGGLLVDTAGWRVGFLINVPLLAVALFATRSTRRRVARHLREQTLRLARGAWWLSLPSVALRSGLIRGQSHAWTGHGGLDRDRRRDGLPRAVPVADEPAPRTRWFRSRCFARATSPRSTSRRSSSTERCTSAASTRRSSSRASSATPRSLPASSGCRPGSCWPCCRRGSGTMAGRIGRQTLPADRTVAHGRRGPLVRPPAGRFGAVEGVDPGPGDPRPAGERLHRHPAVRRSSSGSGCRASWPR